MSAGTDHTKGGVGTRFRKGVSGNPAGRPRKVAPATDLPFSAFDIVMDRTLPVSEGGALQKLTVEEALQLKTYQQALAGSLMARKAILKMIAKREEARTKQASARPRPAVPVTQRTEDDPDNADEALVLLGIAMPNPDRVRFATDRAQLLLEPWAVQAALSRRRGAAVVTESDVATIIRCTRDHASLTWPRRSRD